ncbi:MAG: DUF6242 domain-containing protein [Bacteroidales bacterium]|nr:DUF6242 domain-containing protein [Bacteroidales bacterium]
MMRKKNSLLIISVIISGLFVSCWDNFTERTYYSANITSFGFDAHDTCPDIEDYDFNIDQMSNPGLIFNLDSLPYGRVVNCLFPTVNFQSSNGNVYMSDSDSLVLWNSTDSINFSSPVIFKNTSSDGLYTREYQVKVNVHLVDPDSMLMNQYAAAFPTDANQNKIFHPTENSFLSFFALATGGLSAYLSTDKGLTWNVQPVSGITETVNINSLCTFQSKYFVTSKSNQLYSSSDGLVWTQTGDGTKIVTLFGAIKDKYYNVSHVNYLIGIVENASGEYHFSRSKDGINWKDTIGNEINPDFPWTDYALVKGTTTTDVEFYTIATGLDKNKNFSASVWSTETGLDWVLIDDGSNEKTAIVKRKGASLFYYDNYLVCFGGQDANGDFRQDLYVSEDQGKGWTTAPDNWAFLNMINGLAYPSAYVEHVKDFVNDKDREFIWIFGGTKGYYPSSAIWKGYLNKMMFLRR